MRSFQGEGSAREDVRLETQEFPQVRNGEHAGHRGRQWWVLFRAGLREQPR